MIMLTNEERAALQKKYFPRVPWTERGPVRRMYLVRSAESVTDTPLGSLASLAAREGFTEPDQRSVSGGAEVTLEAFRERARGAAVGMIFGTETAAHWCDIALDAPDGDGWQRLIVRSEEGENLVALAHAEGLLRFRRA